MQIEHIALLARLELKEEEKKLFSEQLERIIEYVDKLNELDTADVTPTAHVVPLKNVFRADKLKQSLPKDKALQNAPHRVDDFYGVPKIIE